jgi:diketogulonate reductase-like aldo/keto reductase
MGPPEEHGDDPQDLQRREAAGEPEVFDFEISDEDMEKIKSIERNYRTNQPAKFWGIDLYA